MFIHSESVFPFATNNFNPYSFGTIKHERINICKAKIIPNEEPIKDSDGSLNMGTIKREIHIYDKISVPDIYILFLKNRLFRPYRPILEIHDDNRDILDSRLDFFRNKNKIEYQYHIDDEIYYFIVLTKEEYDANKETIFEYNNKVFGPCSHYKKHSKFVKIYDGEKEVY